MACLENAIKYLGIFYVTTSSDLAFRTLLETVADKRDINTKVMSVK